MITSKDNEKIKYLKKLSQKKYRDKTGQFLVENLVIINDAICSGFIPSDLFISNELVKKGRDKIEYILDKFPNHFLIDENVNKSFSSLDTPSGICAIFDRIDRKIDFSHHVVYLNGVSDPGNLGTILRTALAFGFKDMVVDENCADIYNPKTIQASKDAIFKLRIEKDENLVLFDEIQKKMKVYATSMQGKDLESLKMTDNFCMVFGNESQGVSPEILKKVDGTVAIRMRGEIESLNVAISAGIILNSISSGLSDF